MLGKGAPNEYSDGGVRMCGIVLSEQLGLIRIHPMDVMGSPSVWDRVSMSLVRHNKDNRDESYTIEGMEHEGHVQKYEKRELLDACILKSGDCDPVCYQNENRRSIAVVRPNGLIGASLQPRELCPDKSDRDYQNWVVTQSEYGYTPYINWKSIQGVEHKQHCVAQELYCGLINNRSAPYSVFDNMRLSDQDYEHWLVLGNMKDRRNVWVVVHVHRLKKTAQPLTLPNCGIAAGKLDGWPYLNQEGFNAKPAEPQLQFQFTT